MAKKLAKKRKKLKKVRAAKKKAKVVKRLKAKVRARKPVAAKKHLLKARKPVALKAAPAAKARLPVAVASLLEMVLLPRE